MPEVTNEHVFDSIDFPHNKWRKLNDKDRAVAKDRTLVYIKHLRDLKMPVDVIKSMISDMYWDAFVEHELQVKESTAKTVKEFFTDKAKQDLVAEIKDQPTTSTEKVQ